MHSPPYHTTKKLRNGYVMARDPLGRRRYTPFHRLLMEVHLGRELLAHEHVHHVNGVKTDNRLENLRVVTRAEHSALHIQEKIAAGVRGVHQPGIPGQTGPRPQHCKPLTPCAMCGKMFRQSMRGTTRPEPTQCCSRACGNKLRHVRAGTARQPINCAWCGKECTPTDSRSKTCSARCGAKKRWAEQRATA